MSLAPAPPRRRTPAGELPPTPRMMEIYTFIYEHARDRGFQPSYREIAVHFRGQSRPGVFVSAVRALAAKGWIDRDARTNRSFRFLRKPDGTKFAGFCDKPAEATA
jgi:SOS-response transcriptional repressor LexA